MITTSLIPIDEVVHFDVCTHAPSTGAVSDADSTPTFSVYEEATDTAILSAQNFTKRTSLTGNYRGTFTASAANGFEAGKWYSVIASATVGAIAAKKNCGSFRVAPAESTAGVPITDPQAATVRAAVGLASANLDTQLGAIDDFLDTEVAAILAAVDTEVAAILALLDDPRTEPGQVNPPVNPDMATKVDYLYKSWRNKKTNDGTTTKLYADDATTVDQKQSTSEAAGTVTKGEWAVGP